METRRLTEFSQILAECIRDADCIVGEVEDPERAENEETRITRERRTQFRTN